MKHSDLVKIAAMWLIRAKACNPVFTEKGSAGTKEFPDAIGWTAAECFLVECKASRADLQADFKKPHRQEDGEGMGSRRFMLMTGLVYQQCQDIIPEGWGVVIASSLGVPSQERFKGSRDFKSNIERERNYLRSRILEIQRFGQGY